MSEPVLSVQELHAGYEDLEILHGVDLRVEAGERILVFGPNGSGKSTLLKAICGLVRTFRGLVRLKGRDLTGLPPERIVAQGISYVPQVDNLFPTLTVAENLEIGGVLDRHRTRHRTRSVFELFPRLAERRHQAAGTLSGGERQMVAMGRALMLQPEVLLLDEPSAGLAPSVAEETFDHVLRINREHGTAILLVEQDVRQGLRLADRAYVLETGRVRLEGTPSELGNSEEVRAIYLGSDRVEDGRG
ncbi:MAG: ABC transporter ATP-binding protein [Actinomycetota bacterium]|nr:ABC transporter ATP-binding protein [Actinomycetota bacterium]